MREECSFSPVQVRRFDALNSPQRVAEKIGEGIRMREPERRSALRTGEMSGSKEELPPQPLQGGALQARRRARSLEPRKQIVRQQHELEESLGATEILHGDLVERVRGLEFPDNEFGPGAIVVETPHRQRGPVQIGNEDLIRVPFHLEEVQLRGGFLGHWATNDDEPRRPLPPLRTIAELGRPDAAPDLTVAQSAQAVFDGSCQSSRDRIPRARRSSSHARKSPS